MRFTAILVMLIMLMPGCLEDIFPGDETNVPGEEKNGSTTIVMKIFHGETLENATANYTITIELDSSAAPIHTANMLAHVEAGNFDMTHFHRIIDDFMIQGGDFTNHDGTGGHAADWHELCNGQPSGDSSCDGSNELAWTIPDEADNGLQHFACRLSMAKTSQPNTAGSQFFIIPDDINHHYWLDDAHTVFGIVTEGCEHITTISEVATGQNDRPIVPVIILSAEVV